MNGIAYEKLTELASRPESMEKAVEYLTEHLGSFLRRRDKVLICFPDDPATIGRLMKEAVLRCEAVPQFLGTDRRWLTILKTAFMARSNAIIGPPLLLLGLAKVAKHMGTPLFARNVLVSGYPSKSWMVNGIQQGLDCRVWGCYDPGFSAMVAGFGCPKGHIHLHSSWYRALIQDENGKCLKAGEIGRVVLSPIGYEDICFDTGDLGRLDTEPCGCGWEDPRLMDLTTNNGLEQSLSELSESFHYWGSILDCRMSNNGSGLELELIVFPGEKLPKFPNCAKLVVRAWNPEKDEPFAHDVDLKHRIFSRETH